MTKKIGIVGSVQGKTIGITLPYYSYFNDFGDVVIINPMHESIHSDLDLLVLPGGPDISTSGTVPNVYTGKPDIFLDHFDAVHLNEYIKLKIPVFGICRGMQAINKLFGGSIVQHLPMETSNTRDELVETILLGEDELNVNSLHHQAVMPSGLSKYLSPIAISKKYGNVEALQHKSLDIAGVQFHPEEISIHEPSSYIVMSIISSMLGM